MAETFTQGIGQFIQKVKGKEGAFLRELCQDLFQKMVEETPVDTGFARASWYIGINNDAMAHSAGVKGQKVDWNKVFAESQLKLKDAKIGDTVYLMNNAAYIRRLEYGHSQQAPQGMVRVTLANYQTIAAQVVARLNK